MKRLLGMSAALCLFANVVSAADTILWKEVGGWGVYMDPSLGNGCFVLNVYEDGTLLRLGFNFTVKPTTIYLALGNDKWKSLEVGKDYPIQIQFDRSPAWDATASAIEMNQSKFLVVSTTDPNFASEFASKLSMRSTFSGREIAHLRLNGSAKAISEMLNCQQAVNSTKKSDPFEADPGVKSSSDPFEL